MDDAAAKPRPGLDCALDTYTEWAAFSSTFPMVLLHDWRMNLPPTLRERVMLRFVDSVTDTAGWEDAVFDLEQIDSYYDDRFKLAARSDLKTAGGEERTPEFDAITSRGHVGFSDDMFDWAIWELQAKALEYRLTGLLSVYDMNAAVFKKEIPALRELVAESLRPLEEEALAYQSVHWQPGHNETNLKVIQPALYALEYDRTRVIRDDVVTRENCLDLIGQGEVLSTRLPLPRRRTAELMGHHVELSIRFQLLPTEVQLDTKGKSHIMGYINNVHPVKRAKVYQVIERILDEALPLFKAAFNSVRPSPDPECPRFPYPPQRCLDPHFCKNAGPKEWWNDDRGCKPQNYRYVHGAPDSPSAEEMAEWFTRTHPVVEHNPLDTTAAREAFLGAHRYDAPRSWAEPGGRFQVIVSVGNILLTPEKPKYTSGVFHFEGLLNERICALALYYYDSDNITDSRLAFEGGGHPHPLELIPESNVPYSRDREWCEELFGTFPKTRCAHQFVKLGAVETRPGRLVVFPNVLGHRVEPFELEDKSRPGHRKVVAIFLVDPATPIISTANIPPQQKHWAKDQECVFGTAVTGLETAHLIAEELISERSNVPTGHIGIGMVD